MKSVAVLFVIAFVIYSTSAADDCPDRCTEPYSPICAENRNDAALFYNKCKYDVAKCNTRGVWRKLRPNDCMNRFGASYRQADDQFRSASSPGQGRIALRKA